MSDNDNDSGYFSLGNALLLAIAILAAIGLVLSSPQAGMIP